MHITFVHAPEDHYDQNYGTQFVPLWAYCLAAHVPEGWQTTIVDCKNQDPRTCGPADVFAFSGINQDVDRIREVWTLLKERYPDATFILGGPITWSFEQEGKLGSLEYFDHLFILDGEDTLPEFLNGFAAGRRAAKVIRAERLPLDRSRRLPLRALPARLQAVLRRRRRGLPRLPVPLRVLRHPCAAGEQPGEQ